MRNRFSIRIIRKKRAKKFCAGFQGISLGLRPGSVKFFDTCAEIRQRYDFGFLSFRRPRPLDHAFVESRVRGHMTNIAGEPRWNFDGSGAKRTARATRAEETWALRVTALMRPYSLSQFLSARSRKS